MVNMTWHKKCLARVTLITTKVQYATIEREEVKHLCIYTNIEVYTAHTVGDGTRTAFRNVFEHNGPPKRLLPLHSHDTGHHRRSEVVTFGRLSKSIVEFFESDLRKMSFIVASGLPQIAYKFHCEFFPPFQER
jgi:hypothetical protein